jgi:hypothetical protein
MPYLKLFSHRDHREHRDIKTENEKDRAFVEAG